MPWQKFSTPIASVHHQPMRRAAGRPRPTTPPAQGMPGVIWSIGDVAEEPDGLDHAEDPEAARQADPIGRGAAEERPRDQTRSVRSSPSRCRRPRARSTSGSGTAGSARSRGSRRTCRAPGSRGSASAPERRKSSSSGSNTASRSERGGGAADRAAPATRGRRRPAARRGARARRRPGGQPSRCPSVIVSAPGRAARPLRASALRAPTASALLGPLQHLDRVRVDDDVLRRRAERDRRARAPRRRRRRRSAPKPRDPGSERISDELADRGSRTGGARGAEARSVAVHQRRPQKLEAPGRLGEREEADRLDVHAAIRQERRQRDPDEPERQPRGERLERDRADAAGGERRPSGSRHVPTRAARRHAPPVYDPCAPCPTSLRRLRRSRGPSRAAGRLRLPRARAARRDLSRARGVLRRPPPDTRSSRCTRRRPRRSSPSGCARSATTSPTTSAASASSP